MVGLAPGTILQMMYLSKRLLNVAPGHFLEIGPGAGQISKLLLDSGWTGVAYDLENITVAKLQNKFSNEIRDGKYEVFQRDYLESSAELKVKFDLIIHCMVIEHLDDPQEKLFMQLSSQILRNGGLMIGLVPSSPSHWGIEDDIAGHYRRYTREGLNKLGTDSGWTISHLAGLTYPISNFLLPISNFLVRRAESSKLDMTNFEKTKASGNRDVFFKTSFPNFLSVILNRYTLTPFYYLQVFFSSKKNSLVLYFEATPNKIKV